MAGFSEGQTATHKDGRRVVFSGGEWRLAKGAAAAPRKLSVQDNKSLNEVRAAGRNAEDVMSDINRFSELNKQERTGGVFGLPGVGYLAERMDPGYGEMNSITARMAPAQRTPGSGTTSDRDLSLFLKAVPSMDRPRKTNEAIRRRADKEADHRVAYAEFSDRFAKNNGSLAGVDEAFRNSVRTFDAPSRAVEDLYSNPKLAVQFDAKFGRGSSASFLRERQRRK